MNWRRTAWRKQPKPAAAPRVPWDLSPRPKSGDDVDENVPCDGGRRVGATLARLADQAEERLRGVPDLHPRCVDCAFRAGTGPNGTLLTVMDGIKCVVEGRPFFCHRGVRDGERPKVLCAGASMLYEGPEHDLMVAVVRQMSEGTDAGPEGQGAGL